MELKVPYLVYATTCTDLVEQIKIAPTAGQFAPAAGQQVGYLLTCILL